MQQHVRTETATAIVGRSELIPERLYDARQESPSRDREPDLPLRGEPTAIE